MNFKLNARAIGAFALLLTTFTLLILGMLGRPTAVNASNGPALYTPTYTASGDLIPPMNYRDWVYLTSGFDMSYTPNSSPDMHKFDNVFVNREAYDGFMATGHWPDKTVMVLEERSATSKGSINQHGNYQAGDVMGIEVHVRDEKRFAGGWAFFDVQSPTKATLFPQTADCYSCHKEHAAVDTTFVQFYPTLLPAAEKYKTLSPGYLKENASQAGK
jgi:hypothetical protein